MTALLNAGHIDHIIKDLNYRGIVLEGFQDEVIDHVCPAVETEMERGKLNKLANLIMPGE